MVGGFEVSAGLPIPPKAEDAGEALGVPRLKGDGLAGFCGDWVGVADAVDAAVVLAGASSFLAPEKEKDAPKGEEAGLAPKPKGDFVEAASVFFACSAGAAPPNANGGVDAAASVEGFGVNERAGLGSSFFVSSSLFASGAVGLGTNENVGSLASSFFCSSAAGLGANENGGGWLVPGLPSLAAGFGAKEKIGGLDSSFLSSSFFSTLASAGAGELAPKLSADLGC